MTDKILKSQIVRFKTRQEWRTWLAKHFNTDSQVWFTFPMKGSKKSGISYNDAVEEALCFGWIDSQAKTVGTDRLQRSLKIEVDHVLAEPFVWPEDILETIHSDPKAWSHFQTFSEPYKRIRIAYIEGARKRPSEFARRLNDIRSRWHQQILLIPRIYKATLLVR